jgi:hypothetical protein
MKWLWVLCLPGVLWAEPLTMPSENDMKLPKGPLDNLSQVKGVSCRDILLNDQSFSDPDVSLVFQHVFTLCTMEVSMQKYIEYRQSFKEKDDEVTAQTKRELLRLQKILPTFLNAFKITEEMFNKNNLREKLNEKLSEYRQNNTLDQDSY